MAIPQLPKPRAFAQQQGNQLAQPWVIKREAMAASASNTPFDGQPAQVRVTALYMGGVAVG